MNLYSELTIHITCAFVLIFGICIYRFKPHFRGEDLQELGLWQTRWLGHCEAKFVLTRLVILSHGLSSPAFSSLWNKSVNLHKIPIKTQVFHFEKLYQAKMKLLELPLEIVRAIVEALVNDVGVCNVLRYRLVCRVFCISLCRTFVARLTYP